MMIQMRYVLCSGLAHKRHILNNDRINPCDKCGSSTRLAFFGVSSDNKGLVTCISKGVEQKRIRFFQRDQECEYKVKPKEKYQMFVVKIPNPEEMMRVVINYRLLDSLGMIEETYRFMPTREILDIQLSISFEDGLVKAIMDRDKFNFDHMDQLMGRVDYYFYEGASYSIERGDKYQVDFYKLKQYYLENLASEDLSTQESRHLPILLTAAYFDARARKQLPSLAGPNITHHKPVLNRIGMSRVLEAMMVNTAAEPVQLERPATPLSETKVYTKEEDPKQAEGQEELRPAWLEFLFGLSEKWTWTLAGVVILLILLSSLPGILQRTSAANQVDLCAQEAETFMNNATLVLSGTKGGQKTSVTIVPSSLERDGQSCALRFNYVVYSNVDKSVNEGTGWINFETQSASLEHFRQGTLSFLNENIVSKLQISGIHEGEPWELELVL